MREVVKANGTLYGSALGRANFEAERRPQIRPAEGVGADEELPLAFDVFSVTCSLSQLTHSSSILL